MLVYFVNHSVAPVNLGGAERSMIKLVEDWYASDPTFEAFFLTKAPKGQFIKAIEERGWKYRAFRYRGWTIPKPNAPLSEITYFAREDYASTLEIIKEMERRRPDLVVTNTIVAPWGAFAAKVLGIPHAWFIREYGDLDHGLAFQIGRGPTFEDIGLMSEVIFTNSLAVREHVGQYVPIERLNVVYPQIDTRALAERAAETPAVQAFGDDDALRVTVVGRVKPNKGQWRVIEAMGLLASRGVDIRLCVVGSWEQAGYDMELAARARELGVGDRVVFTGEQPNPFPYIAAADVCVTPSSIEAFGRTTLEFMLSGKAVVASNAGGSAELVDPGVTGWLYDPDDIEELAAHLERYATDRATARAHGVAARARAESLMTEEFSNAAAISKLQTAATLEPYRLPNIARYWFALPGHFAAMTASPRITVPFIMTRVKGRAKRWVIAPVAAVARRVRRGGR
ncbi:MAG: glycosyltransferase family 4 protein [Actinomycetes bacterium]